MKGMKDFQGLGSHLFIFLVLLSLLMATNVRSVNRLPAPRSYSHLPDALLRAVISIKLFWGVLVRMLTLSLEEECNSETEEAKRAGKQYSFIRVSHLPVVVEADSGCDST